MSPYSGKRSRAEPCDSAVVNLSLIHPALAFELYQQRSPMRAQKSSSKAISMQKLIDLRKNLECLIMSIEHVAAIWHNIIG